ncbi:MAG: LptF/LptG family permease [Maricaulaceae bacterium]
MTKIQRYVQAQLTAPLLAALGALAALALLVQSLATLDIVIDARGEVWALVWVTLAAAPLLVAMVLPIAGVAATLYAATRLQADSELTVASASGLSRWALLEPFLRVALWAAVANLALNLFIQPAAHRHMREVVHTIRSDLTAAFLSPGDFSTIAPGVTFYARKADAARTLTDILLEDRRAEAETTLYLAETARFAPGPAGPRLLLSSGSVQTQTAEGANSILAFDQYALDLADFTQQLDDFVYKPSDRYLPELLFPDDRHYWNQNHRGRLLAEGHYRLSAPLYVIALIWIAALAVLAAEPSRTGHPRRVIAAVAVALVVRLTGFALQSASADTPALNVLQYAWPLSVIAACAVLSQRSGRRRAPSAGALEPAAGALEPA